MTPTVESCPKMWHVWHKNMQGHINLESHTLKYASVKIPSADILAAALTVLKCT